MKQAHLYIPVSYKKHKDSRISCYVNLEQEMSILFKTYRKIIFIMAAGIAVRMVAPYLKSKWEDPAVVVMDDQGKNIISLLSGHWGGANELTRDLAQLLGGHRVITTASDIRGLPALDVMIKELGTDSFSKQKLKKIQSALIAGNSRWDFIPKSCAVFPRCSTTITCVFIIRSKSLWHQIAVPDWDLHMKRNPQLNTSAVFSLCIRKMLLLGLAVTKE